jgi:hypothetical protein
MKPSFRECHHNVRFPRLAPKGRTRTWGSNLVQRFRPVNESRDKGSFDFVRLRLTSLRMTGLRFNHRKLAIDSLSLRLPAGRRRYYRFCNYCFF